MENNISRAIKLVMDYLDEFHINGTRDEVSNQINSWYAAVGIKNVTPYELAALDIEYKNNYFQPTFDTLRNVVERVYPEVIYGDLMYFSSCPSVYFR